MIEAQENYCLTKVTTRDNTYLTRVPRQERGLYYKKYFGSKRGDSKLEAKRWRDQIGQQEWGKDRWALILFIGKTTPFRGDWKAVYSYMFTVQGALLGWRVVWREEGENHAKLFKVSDYGRAKAKKAAHLFENNKRSELRFHNHTFPTPKVGDWITVQGEQCLIVNVDEGCSDVPPCEVIYNTKTPTNRNVVWRKGQWQWESFVNLGDYADEIDRLKMYLKFFKEGPGIQSEPI